MLGNRDVDVGRSQLTDPSLWKGATGHRPAGQRGQAAGCRSSRSSLPGRVAIASLHGNSGTALESSHHERRLRRSALHSFGANLEHVVFAGADERVPPIVLLLPRTSVGNAWRRAALPSEYTSANVLLPDRAGAAFGSCP